MICVLVLRHGSFEATYSTLDAIVKAMRQSSTLTDEWMNVMAKVSVNEKE